jgi:hypothetical protein
MERAIGKYRLPNIMAVCALGGLVMAAYLRWVRPYQLRWGATDEEVQRPMPGDELNPNPKFLATRAITIEGKPEDVWPWLVQMGYRRAGFYGYDILENLGSPRGLRSADRILPEFQHFTVGDEVPISPAGGLVFHAIEPNRYLIWSGEAGWGGFTWALYPMDGNHTRLVSRIRWSHSWTKPRQLALDLITEFADYLGIRKILQGVKGRVEGQMEPMAQGNIEFAVYLASLLSFLGAVVWILVRPLTWRRWLAGFAAGVAWLTTWYAPVPIWGGALLELLALGGLGRASHQSSWRSPA